MAISRRFLTSLVPAKHNAACWIAILLSFMALRASARVQPSVNTDAEKATPTFLHVGGGVSPPKPIFSPDPEYSEEARKAYYEGVVVLGLVVGPDGLPRYMKVLRSLGLGLDESAIEAVKQWRFNPAMKDGKPVAVYVSVEVDFRLGRNNSKVSKLWKKAKAGNANAELELATIYFEGADVPKEEALGFTLLRRAADHGLPRAQFLMGERVYAHGGDAADYLQAYAWYDLARRGGYKDSEKMLEELASKMSTEQLSEAKRQVENWQNGSAK